MLKDAGSVKVSAKRDGEKIIFTNDHGWKWVFELKDDESGTVSVASRVGNILIKVLCSTIALTVYPDSAKILEYELTAKYYKSKKA